MDWTTELADQLDCLWQHAFRPGLDGLTDDEYLWEPVPGCWSLRPRAEPTTPMAAGLGEVVAIHHAAEVSLLRDLYLHTKGPR